MAKATKKSVTKSARSVAPAAAKYPRSTMARVMPVAEAQEEAREEAQQSVAVVAVAPSVNRRVAPELNTAKMQSKATAAARAASAVKAGKSSVRNASGSMMTKRVPLIRAENFGYVPNDLRIIGGIAVAMVLIMIVLRMVLKI